MQVFQDHKNHSNDIEERFRSIENMVTSNQPVTTLFPLFPLVEIVGDSRDLMKQFLTLNWLDIHMVRVEHPVKYFDRDLFSGLQEEFPHSLDPRG